jgi:hypothetical protein
LLKNFSRTRRRYPPVDLVADHHCRRLTAVAQTAAGEEGKGAVRSRLAHLDAELTGNLL